MQLSALEGNKKLKHRLAGGGAARGLAHAYIIGGMPGTGRHTLGLLLAQAALCQGEGSPRPCGQCAACKKIAGGIHPDVVLLAGEEGKAISVAQVRQMRADAYIRPNEGRRKIYFLEAAGEMNPSGQNALLKLLEEGPEYAMFLLFVHQPGQLLKTVRSRCEELMLTPLTPGETEAALRRRFPQLEEEAIQNASHACDGVLGRGIALLEGADDDRQALERQAAALIRAMIGGDELALFETAMPLENMKKGPLVLLLDQMLVQLSRELPVAPQPRQILRGIALIKTLRAGAEFNANPGQLAGWLCAGMFSQRAGSHNLNA